MKKISNKDLGITPDTEIVDAPDDEDVVIDGKTLTDDEAEALARASLDDIRRRNLIPGGKSLSGSGKHSPVVQVRLSETTRERLQARAASEGVGVSKVARAAIESYLNQH